MSACQECHLLRAVSAAQQGTLPAGWNLILFVLCQPVMLGDSHQLCCQCLHYLHHCRQQVHQYPALQAAVADASKSSSCSNPIAPVDCSYHPPDMQLQAQQLEQQQQALTWSRYRHRRGAFTMFAPNAGGSNGCNALQQQQERLQGCVQHKELICHQQQHRQSLGIGRQGAWQQQQQQQQPQRMLRWLFNGQSRSVAAEACNDRQQLQQDTGAISNAGPSSHSA